MVQEILVVKRDTLFNNGDFHGFMPKERRDFSNLILQNFEYQERNDELENNPSIQQIIPYVWIMNPITGKVFIYQRSNEGGEGRLHNKYSGGVGGHIDKETEYYSQNPIVDAMMRELKEEVTMKNYPTPKFVGFLNDETEMVGRVHFGVVAIAETKEDVKPAEHMSKGQFYSPEEIDRIFSDPNNVVETWTEISWPHIKQYVENLSPSKNSSMYKLSAQAINIGHIGTDSIESEPTLEELKDKILEIFVTSARDHIYAVKSEVPPEMFGAFGSYFSRNPKDFREHIWEAITGQLEEQASKLSGKSLKWLADKNFRSPADAIKKGLIKSQDFFKKWYGSYSHKSIANTVWIPIVTTNISQLFAREIANDQLAFFIEQSTRYVKFDAENMYHDPDIMKSKHSELYSQTLKILASAYVNFLEHSTIFYKKRIPYEKWLALQKDPNALNLDRKYEREIKGKALDIARFLLPQAIKTNIAMILDARSLERRISVWKGHPLKELRDGATLIEKSAGQIAPSLLLFTEENPYYSEKLKSYNQAFKVNPPQSFSKGVDLISTDPDAFDRSIAHILHRHNDGGTFRQRFEEAKNMSFDEKREVLRKVTEKRKVYDEWVETDSDFDLTNITFEIRTDIGAIRDWRRHQKWDRGEPRYTLENGHQRPDILNEMPLETAAIYDQAIEAARKAEMVIKKDFPFEVQYLIPMAANHPIVMSAGLDQLQYIIWTRTTPQGNFSYRQDALNIAKSVCKLMPWLLGYQKYPKDKTFEEVYKEAPLKNIIRIQAFEEGMHE
jgi:predicted NUDIX family phosphoesterase/thymidylate synthase ThyX